VTESESERKQAFITDDMAKVCNNKRSLSYKRETKNFYHGKWVWTYYISANANILQEYFIFLKNTKAD